jgi:hypothetical protein
MPPSAAAMAATLRAEAVVVDGERRLVPRVAAAEDFAHVRRPGERLQT